MLTFVPALNSSLYAAFEYLVCDSTGRCDSAKVDVTVTPLVDVVAKDDKALTRTSQAITIDVTKNDLSSSNKPLLVTDVGAASNGDCEITSDNQVRYTPDANFEGWDKCSYTVCAEDVCDAGRIGIKVFTDIPNTEAPTPKPTAKTTSPSADFDIIVLTANLDPIAKPDAVTIVQNHAAFIDVLVNDSDPDDDELLVKLM